MSNSSKSSTRVLVDQLLWRMAGVWPSAAQQRLWLPRSFKVELPASFTLAISTIVRNEEDYVDEWLEFHRMMGVEHFFIYDNGSTDGTVARLRQSPHADRITIVSWSNFLCGWEGVTGPTGRMQRLAMLHCLANYGHMAEWIAFIDVDEFLYPAKADSLVDLLKEYDDLDSLSVYWRMFGTSKHKERPAGLVTENFTWRSRSPVSAEKNLCRVKTIVRPRAVRGVHNTHTLILSDGVPASWTEKRVRIGYADHRAQFFSDDVIRLNHYYSKSLNEYHRRRTVPANGDRNDFRGNDRLLTAIESDSVEDLAIQRFVPELKRRLSSG